MDTISMSLAISLRSTRNREMEDYPRREKGAEAMSTKGNRSLL